MPFRGSVAEHFITGVPNLLTKAYLSWLVNFIKVKEENVKSSKDISFMFLR